MTDDFGGCRQPCRIWRPGGAETFRAAEFPARAIGRKRTALWYGSRGPTSTFVVSRKHSWVRWRSQARKFTKSPLRSLAIPGNIIRNVQGRARLRRRKGTLSSSFNLPLSKPAHKVSFWRRVYGGAPFQGRRRPLLHLYCHSIRHQRDLPPITILPLLGKVAKGQKVTPMS